MRATVKGIKLNVTVNLSLGELRTTKNEERKGETPRTRSVDNLASGVDINAGIGFEVESYEGEINLSELSEMVKTCLTDSIREQVREEMQNTSIPEETKEKMDGLIKTIHEGVDKINDLKKKETTDKEEVIHNVDGDTPPTKEEMKEIDNLLRKENTEKEDDGELY